MPAMCLLVCCFLSRQTCAYFLCQFPGIWLCMHCVGVSGFLTHPVREGRPERQCPASLIQILHHSVPKTICIDVPLQTLWLPTLDRWTVRRTDPSLGTSIMCVCIIVHFILHDVTAPCHIKPFHFVFTPTEAVSLGTRLSIRLSLILVTVTLS